MSGLEILTSPIVQSAITAAAVDLGQEMMDATVNTIGQAIGLQGTKRPYASMAEGKEVPTVIPSVPKAERVSPAQTVVLYKNTRLNKPNMTSIVRAFLRDLDRTAIVKSQFRFRADTIQSVRTNVGVCVRHNAFKNTVNATTYSNITDTTDYDYGLSILEVENTRDNGSLIGTADYHGYAMQYGSVNGTPVKYSTGNRTLFAPMNMSYLTNKAMLLSQNGIGGFARYQTAIDDAITTANNALAIKTCALNFPNETGAETPKMRIKDGKLRLSFQNVATWGTNVDIVVYKSKKAQYLNSGDDPNSGIVAGLPSTIWEASPFINVLKTSQRACDSWLAGRQSDGLNGNDSFTEIDMSKNFLGSGDDLKSNMLTDPNWKAFPKPKGTNLAPIQQRYSEVYRTRVNIPVGATYCHTIHLGGCDYDVGQESIRQNDGLFTLPTGMQDGASTVIEPITDIAGETYCVALSFCGQRKVAQKRFGDVAPYTTALADITTAGTVLVRGEYTENVMPYYAIGKSLNFNKRSKATLNNIEGFVPLENVAGYAKTQNVPSTQIWPAPDPIS